MKRYPLEILLSNQSHSILYTISIIIAIGRCV